MFGDPNTAKLPVNTISYLVKGDPWTEPHATHGDVRFLSLLLLLLRCEFLPICANGDRSSTGPTPFVYSKSIFEKPCLSMLEKETANLLSVNKVSLLTLTGRCKRAGKA